MHNTRSIPGQTLYECQVPLHYSLLDRPIAADVILCSQVMCTYQAGMCLQESVRDQFLAALSENCSPTSSEITVC